MRLTRLYSPDPAFHSGSVIALSDDQSHYLLRVLRQSAGQPIILFNEKAGSWRGSLSVTGKKASVTLEENIQQPVLLPDVWLLVAPLKKEAWDFVLEKATEMGVTAIQPIFTDYTQTARINMERARANVIEAAQQCERTDIPEIFEPLPLGRVLDKWDASRRIYAALEREEVKPMGSAQTTYPAAFLVGPEGGFSPDEKALLSGKKYVTPVSLGPLILRAETAVIAGLARLNS